MDPARVSRRRLARESARPLLALAVALGLSGCGPSAHEIATAVLVASPLLVALGAGVLALLARA